MLQAAAAAELDRQAKEARAALAASEERCRSLQADCSTLGAKLKELQAKHKVSSKLAHSCCSSRHLAQFL